MRPVLVTDVRYRTALAVIRPLARAGYAVYAVQTAAECQTPFAFASRYVGKRVLLEGSVKDDAYPERLLALCREVSSREGRPVLFPIGADTLSVLAKNEKRFRAVCDFLVAKPETLDAANDKRTVAETAKRVNVPVPEDFSGAEPPRFPVILKPRCGEKLGLHAQQRYLVAREPTEYHAALERMRTYDPKPVVQALVEGAGVGVSVLMDGLCRPVCVFCHRRVREYPIGGGPSACCVSIYDEALVAQTVKLLQALRFTGIAMVEWKGGHVLEINPRIWGSFPLTELCGSRFAEHYVRTAAGEETAAPPDCAYRLRRRMRFVLNDTLATLSCLRQGKWALAFGGIADVFRAREALFRFTDQKPFWRYLAQALRGRE